MKNIYQALSNFQQECPTIAKETKGYGYKYASLPTILEIINPLLQKHGLAYSQPLICEEEKRYVKTVLIHLTSGEIIESDVDIPVTSLKGMNDYQSLGSGITYMRRYAISSLLGIVVDEDTDATGKQESITADQQNDIEILLESCTLEDNEITKIRGAIKTMPQEKAVKCIEYLVANQIDVIESGGNYGQKAINKKLDNKMEDEKA